MTSALDTDAAAQPENDDGLTRREILVAAALEERSRELGTLYRWAARTVRSRTPNGWTYLVAHYVRDLLNRLPEYFDVPAADRASVDTLVGELDALWNQGVPTSLSDQLIGQIEALLAEHRRGGENQDRRAEAVMRAGARDTRAQAQVRAGIRAWRHLHGYFQAHAHLMSEEKARTLIIDEDRFAENFDALTALLAARVAREGFFETLGELDELAEIEEPTQEDGDRAGALMRDGLADSFLARIESQGWLPQLQRLDVFSHPPRAIREGGYIQVFRWAAADYLVRIAHRAPAEVLGVIEGIPATDNERIHISFVHAGLRMPPDQAAAVARLVRPWLEAGEVQFGLPEAAAELAAELATDGQGRPARQLMEAALGIRVLGDAPPKVVAHLSDWEIREVFGTHFQALVADDPVRAFGFLAGILQRLIEALHEHLGYAEDSSISRPAIEDHVQNTDVDARAPLLEALRNVGELILREHPDEIERILNIVQNGPPLLRRLALHLIRIDASTGGVARRRAAMLDASGYHELEALHERFLLLAGHFADLDPDDRDAVGEIIAAGPDLDEQYGPATDDDDLERRMAVVAEWKLRWFAAITEHIPEAQVPLYRELTEKYGGLEHPEFLWWHSSWVGPTSPEPRAQLSELPVEEVINRLVSFEAPTGPTMPSPEGLGRVFANVVEAAPERWAQAAAQLENVPPIYVRHFFSGLDAAIRAGKGVESWPEALSLAEAVVARGPAPRIIVPHFSLEEQPGHARDTIARLLHDGMRALAGGCPVRRGNLRAAAVLG